MRLRKVGDLTVRPVDDPKGREDEHQRHRNLNRKLTYHLKRNHSSNRRRLVLRQQSLKPLLSVRPKRPASLEKVAARRNDARWQIRGLRLQEPDGGSRPEKCWNQFLKKVRGRPERRLLMTREASPSPEVPTVAPQRKARLKFQKMSS